MIKRRLETLIKDALQRGLSVALMGPRQVGKTTLALDIADNFVSVYLDLEDPLYRQKTNGIQAFLEEYSDELIILDEVRRLPDIFTSMEGIINSKRHKNNIAGQFFLLDSSAGLLKRSGESLAGNIVYAELQPVDVMEYAGSSPGKLKQQWLRGGFPDSLLAGSEEESITWRKDFIQTCFESRIPQPGPHIPTATLNRFLTMLAHNQGTVLNATHLGRNLEVAGLTIGRYLDLMEDSFLIRQLRPWTCGDDNIAKKLLHAPKIYIRDSGILHTLLNIAGYSDLVEHPLADSSWKGFVLENILSVLASEVHAGYYGTYGGEEIDLVLEFSDAEKWAIEITRNAAPSVSKGFYIACDDIKPTRKYLVIQGRKQFKINEDVIAMPLHRLMQDIMEK